MISIDRVSISGARKSHLEVLKVYSEMKTHREYLLREIAECRQKLKGAPPGKFMVAKDGKHTKWYAKDGDNPRVYIPKKDRTLAEVLACKRYREELLECLLQELNAVDYYLKHTTDNSGISAMLSEDSGYLELLSGITTWSDRELEYMNAKFPSNPFRPEDLIHKSISGHMLRSKSELLIDMELYKNHIPFRYESELRLGPDGKIVYPDFTFCKIRTGEKRYWEHYGRMDDYKYRANALEKIDNYAKNGIIIGDKLWATFETERVPLTIDTVVKTVAEIKTWCES